MATQYCAFGMTLDWMVNIMNLESHLQTGIFTAYYKNNPAVFIVLDENPQGLDVKTLEDLSHIRPERVTVLCCKSEDHACKVAKYVLEGVSSLDRFKFSKEQIAINVYNIGEDEITEISVPQGSEQVEHFNIEDDEALAQKTIAKAQEDVLVQQRYIEIRTGRPATPTDIVSEILWLQVYFDPERCSMVVEPKEIEQMPDGTALERHQAILSVITSKKERDIFSHYLKAVHSLVNRIVLYRELNLNTMYDLKLCLEREGRHWLEVNSELKTILYKLENVFKFKTLEK